MQAETIRKWRGEHAIVFTAGQDGERNRRGTISLIMPASPDPQGRCTWQLYDSEGSPMDDVTGDYLLAEAALFAASWWIDEPADTTDQDDQPEDYPAGQGEEDIDMHDDGDASPTASSEAKPYSASFATLEDAVAADWGDTEAERAQEQGEREDWDAAHAAEHGGDVMIVLDKIEDQAALCEEGAKVLDGEATELALSEPDRAARKLLAAATVRAYAERVLRQDAGPVDEREAALVAWCAQMGGLLMAGRPQAERAAMRRLVTAGVFVYYAEPGQHPFYTLAGYEPTGDWTGTVEEDEPARADETSPAATAACGREGCASDPAAERYQGNCPECSAAFAS